MLSRRENRDSDLPLKIERRRCANGETLEWRPMAGTYELAAIFESDDNPEVAMSQLFRQATDAVPDLR